LLGFVLLMTSPSGSGVGKLALTVALAGLAGCSLAFVHGPPPNHEKIAYFDCSTSNALPTIDLLLAGAAVVDVVGGAVGDSALPSNRAALAGLGLEAAAFAASAIYGYGKTADCRKAQEDMLKRAALTPTLAYPPGYAAPYPPGFGQPQPAPYDPWVAPPPAATPTPTGLSPVGPLPPTPAPTPGPATDEETPRSGSGTPRPGKAVQ